MAFSIKFSKREVSDEYMSKGEVASWATIEIGDFSEDFIVSLNYWSVKDYQKQWINALDELITGDEHGRAILIAGMYDPEKPKFRFAAMVWSLYREDQKVYVRNQWIQHNEVEKPFDSKKIAEHLDDRKPLNKEGLQISEWQTTIAELSDWLAELKRGIKQEIQIEQEIR